MDHLDLQLSGGGALHPEETLLHQNLNAELQLLQGLQRPESNRFWGLVLKPGAGLMKTLLRHTEAGSDIL